MVKYFLAAFVVFALCSLWLYSAMSHGYSTQNWKAVPARVGASNSGRDLRGREVSIHTPVKYSVDGVEYEGYVDDFLVAGSGTIFVNPDDPTEIVGNRGPNLQHYGRPMIFTIVSGLFLVVLGLIAFSPKED